MSEFAKHQIERELEQDRMALARSLVALRPRLLPANLVAEGKDVLMAQASPMVSRLDEAVRAHPVMTAVAGVALAAVVFGRPRPAGTGAATAVPAMAGTKFEALTRWEDEGGPPAPEPVDPDEDWLSEAQSLRARAQILLRQVDDAARRRLAPTAQLAKHRAEILSALAVETREALGKGLGSLGDAAREQAMQARERIYLGRIAMAEKGRAAVDGNPLAVGAMLALAGAAVACLFPQSEAEDRLLGEASDQLVSDLKGLAQREAVEASAFGSTLKEALKTDMRHASQLFTPQEPVVRPVRH